MSQEELYKLRIHNIRRILKNNDKPAIIEKVIEIVDAYGDFNDNFQICAFKIYSQSILDYPLLVEITEIIDENEIKKCKKYLQQIIARIKKEDNIEQERTQLDIALIEAFMALLNEIK